ncbi:glycosyltransferase [Salisediminibacterium halotolerans]|uniref:glycosyltransferase n=1 Tax=Salisediminibacterium halotolerans TaxID=517425 RepID=UPI000EAEB629|nr:glycosyltransferase [Salisediminibacterium halotolerans]RLJ75601.1 glycosyl transferase family 1 [Actinophytocola xinjiangensis]RPE89455.1 glycosyl transferase family 1 [Salisediminibacterium halotolerans]TWG36214.1 glycosyl transferase family 1 [Salisediminibacterium halotolerans]GEL08353.1 hypothetical protein SHA02_17690 [Salisediminibacterium halotolerans]
MKRFETDLNIAANEEIDRQRKNLRELEVSFAEIENGFPGLLFDKAAKAKHLTRQIVKIAKGKRAFRDVFSKRQRKQKAKKQINQLKKKLYEHGFETAVINELKSIVSWSDNPYLLGLASWELAVWHANQDGLNEKRKAMDWFELAETKPKPNVSKRNVNLLKSELLRSLHDHKRAYALITDAMKKEPHNDYLLESMNLTDSIETKINLLNLLLRTNGQEPVFLNTNIASDCYYDQLDSSQSSYIDDGPLVTVLVPVYNAEKTIGTSLRSIVKQTWRNLEIIVIDDQSDDGTIEEVRAWMEADPRIRLKKLASNSGPYAARNTGLNEASGEFVTVQDADDWTHPEKIAYQVNHLLENPDVIANTSSQVRVTEDFHVTRRLKAGYYIYPNMSSLMFRKKPVQEHLGYWDSVRFGADGEFKQRLKEVFGKEAVADLKAGVYSFLRQSSRSLTGSTSFGYQGYFYGIRKEYVQSYRHFHNQATSLKYSFPMTERPFPIPEPLKPERKKEAIRHFDVIIASDFRLLGGTNMSNIEEIKAQRTFGMKTGLVQLYRYDLDSREEWNPLVREQVNGLDVEVVTYGEQVTCDKLIVRHPPILQEWQRYVPEIYAEDVYVIINQPPMRDYTGSENRLYDFQNTMAHLRSYFGHSGIWHPIGPQVRKILAEQHSEEITKIPLSADDWVNIINVEEWHRPAHQPNVNQVRIGRHSRDQYVKWPETAELMNLIYPKDETYQVRVLGGASAAEKILGAIPGNWIVYPFGSVKPHEFLQEIDVYVYYTHSEWVEAFGRSVLEAMAAGVPVILDPKYKELFGSGAVYAKPEEVKPAIQELIADEKTYQSATCAARQFAKENFGYEHHIKRLIGEINHDKRL